jgi:uncharacterized protein
MPQLAAILIYPIKSFDPVSVDAARVLPSGALEQDRRYALYDREGRWINAKRTDKVHAIRARYNREISRVTLEAGGESATFSLETGRDGLEEWLSARFGTAVSLREDRERGFPDDSASPGPTLVGTETLAQVASWYEGLEIDEARRRFRANLEITGEEPFWEDRLYSEEGNAVRFRVGEVEFAGVNPCARCIVPTRSSTTGERTPEFGRIFEQKRYETLPYWATRSRFDHFYRLAVNTRPVTAAGGIVRVGDPVEIVATG